MRFGPVPLDAAEGAVMAHSLQLEGQRLRKGRVLSAEDVAAMAAAGLDEVIVARLDEGDIGEDAAAGRIAQAMVPDPDAAHLRMTAAKTGRVNLYATMPGVLALDVAAIEAANRVDPMVTVATLPPFARCVEKTMTATVKIISYGVAEPAVARAAELIAGAMRLRPVVLKTATLIQTDIGGGPGKGEKPMRARLEALGMDLVGVETVPHRTAPLSEAVAAADGDLVLILTASATSDPGDVGPEAVRAAGGDVTRFGMPVDPGNLLFLGHQGRRPVIGLPGCARSPALNGADWVLERVACGLDVSDADIAAMGVGGLLKESPARPHPREKR
ncbi:molybdopterin-binding protein [Psychromarinibacter sp. C21-152]|uniref:Molybdopterin-binding protein n=1 Tax=Psychromarinibacter sediminicola TaxID=3033385 RepID=A0AAE3NRA4_9RHOB|nr:molybdopterin-binding protein [Psychromarinibacter sediminicola]MDF0600611.1 molybdopterin-binding protein [Psychromarinibacter sediminicola]